VRSPGAVVVTALTVAASAVLAACGSPAAPVRDDGVAVATYEPSGVGGMEALLTGTVENTDGCLTIRGTDPDTGEVLDEELYVPVFAITDPSATRLAIGESVRLGGGWAGDADAEWTVPDACPPEGPFWVLPSS
jgi:hypothetical protein